MSDTALLSQSVESFRFGDVAAFWARERLVHEIIVARALARAVVCDGLRLQSVDARWMAPQGTPVEFRGYPYVGYAARPGALSVLRISALNHLLAIVERGEEPDLRSLFEEFIFRDDFRAWLLERNQPLPKFWFA